VSSVRATLACPRHSDTTFAFSPAAFICQAKDDMRRLLEDREELLKRIAELKEQKWRGSRG
jgi:hypothetical protein